MGRICRAWRGGLTALLVLVGAGCRPPASDAYQGYIEGEYVYVSSPIDGELLDLLVRRGDVVTNRQALFVLEREREAAGVDSALARLAQARSDLANRRKGSRPSELDALEAALRRLQADLALAGQDQRRREAAVAKTPGAVSEEELDRARSRVLALEAEVARLSADLVTAGLGAREDEIQMAIEVVAARAAELKEARWRFDQKARFAPAAAAVHDTLYREGEWVGAMRPVVSLLPPENVKVRFFVPEPDLARIRIGNPVRVRWDGADRDYRAVVRYVSTRAEYTPPVIYSQEVRAKLVFLIEAFFAPEDAAGLKAGQPVDVWIESE